MNPKDDYEQGLDAELKGAERRAAVHAQEAAKALRIGGPNVHAANAHASLAVYWRLQADAINRRIVGAT